MNRTKTLVFVFLALWVLPVLSAFAAVDMKKITPLGKVEFLPTEEFEKKTDLYKETPYSDKALSYEIRLPKGWLAIDVPPSEKPLALNKSVIGVVAKYASPARKYRRSFVTIEAQGLNHEIGARNWFLNYLENTGYTLEGIGPESPDHSSMEAIYITVEGDITYAVMVKLFINGPRIILARYYVPVELFKEEQIMQRQSINSFNLTGKRLYEIEERETYGFLDQAYFDYPVSWKLRAPKVLDVERMRAMVYRAGPENTLYGQINIYLTSRFIDTSLTDELKRYIERLNVPNYKLGGKIEGHTLMTHKDIEFARTEVYKFEPQVTRLQQYELWATLMQSDGFYYIITMLTPSREADFYQWARNVRSYEVIVATSRQYDPAIDQFKFSK